VSKPNGIADLNRHERKAVDAFFRFALACGISATDAAHNVGLLEQAVRHMGDSAKAVRTDER
jgi:hypothetical protein